MAAFLFYSRSHSFLFAFIRSVKPPRDLILKVGSSSIPSLYPGLFPQILLPTRSYALRNVTSLSVRHPFTVLVPAQPDILRLTSAPHCMAVAPMPRMWNLESHNQSLLQRSYRHHEYCSFLPYPPLVALPSRCLRILSFSGAMIHNTETVFYGLQMFESKVNFCHELEEERMELAMGGIEVYLRR